MARTTIARGGMPARRGKPAVPPVAASRTVGQTPMPPPSASGLSTPAFKKGGKVKKKGKK